MTNRTMNELIDDAVTTAGNNGNTYLVESSIFDHLITKRRELALRTIEDLNSDIARLQAEIDERIRRRADNVNIVARADAALALSTTSPYAETTEAETTIQLGQQQQQSPQEPQEPSQVPPATQAQPQHERPLAGHFRPLGGTPGVKDTLSDMLKRIDGAGHDPAQGSEA